MSGKIVGVDRAQVQARNPQTGILETRRIFCAVVIPFRVRIIIPEMEMWVQGEERPGFVLRNTPGASVDFVIIRVDRENNLAVASRRAALSSRRYYFSTQPSMNRPGSRIQCGVMAVGPSRCLVTCNGYDIDLVPRDLSYASLPDLRETYHPGDVLDCVVKEYDSRAGTLSISVKEIEPNPFDGAEFRHPEGCTREAVISGKYGGGRRVLHAPGQRDRDVQLRVPLRRLHVPNRGPRSCSDSALRKQQKAGLRQNRGQMVTE